MNRDPSSDAWIQPPKGFAQSLIKAVIYAHVGNMDDGRNALKEAANVWEKEEAALSRGGPLHDWHDRAHYATMRREVESILGGTDIE